MPDERIGGHSTLGTRNSWPAAHAAPIATCRGAQSSPLYRVQVFERVVRRLTSWGAARVTGTGTGGGGARLERVAGVRPGLVDAQAGNFVPWPKRQDPARDWAR